jgi:hypothetical protein
MVALSSLIVKFSEFYKTSETVKRAEPDFFDGVVRDIDNSLRRKNTVSVLCLNDLQVKCLKELFRNFWKGNPDYPKSEEMQQQVSEVVANRLNLLPATEPGRNDVVHPKIGTNDLEVLVAKILDSSIQYRQETDFFHPQ